MPSVLNVGVGLGARYGGPGTSLEDMWRAIACRGWRVTAVTVYLRDVAANPEARAVTDSCGAGCYERIPHRAALRWHWSLAQLQWLKRHLYEYDILHLHSLYSFPVLAAATLAISQGVPYVVTCHGVLDAAQRRTRSRVKSVYDRLFGRRILTRAAAIICSSRREMRDAAEACLHRRVVLVPNGINLKALGNLPPGDKFKQNRLAQGSAPVVLYLGRLESKKGLEVLVPAFAEVLESCPQACLVLVGVGDPPGYEFRIRALVKKWGIAGRVVFTGLVSEDERLAAFASADIFVLPSRSENFGTAIFEAMACRLPVVVSKGVDLWPEIEAAGAGLAAKLEAKALTRAIVSLANDPARRAEMGARGREFASTYTWDRTALHLTALYGNVISSAVVATGVAPTAL